MKTLATLAAILILTACTSAPSASTASSPAQAATVAETAGRPVPDHPADKVVTTAKPRQICKDDESTGSRMKRRRCYDAPDDDEKANRDDILRDNTDELRQLDQLNTLRTTENVLGR